MKCMHSACTWVHAPMVHVHMPLDFPDHAPSACRHARTISDHAPLHAPSPYSWSTYPSYRNSCQLTNWILDYVFLFDNLIVFWIYFLAPGNSDFRLILLLHAPMACSISYTRCMHHFIHQVHALFHTPSACTLFMPMHVWFRCMHEGHVHVHVVFVVHAPSARAHASFQKGACRQH